MIIAIITAYKNDGGTIEIYLCRRLACKCKAVENSLQLNLPNMILFHLPKTHYGWLPA